MNINRRKTLSIIGISMSALLASKNSEAAEVHEDYIDGDFNGWNGDSIYQLRSGHVIQQSRYAYSYSFAFCPKVLIIKDGMDYKIKVDGNNTLAYIKFLT